ncbi:MAG: TIGR01777 family oxidoreductase [Parachlamydiaceae bacterium]
MKILISGSSGLVGSALIPFFEQRHHEVYKLVRKAPHVSYREIFWDSDQGVVDPMLLEGVDAVIHLAAESIMGRWSDHKKDRIKESRVKGTRLLCLALSQLKTPPSVLIVASAIGYYGDCQGGIRDEQSPKGSGFLSDVCQEWEEATQIAAKRGIRVINLRIGMVLSPLGGALKQMLPIFKLGLGGKIGTGDQMVSWISIDDLVRAIDFIIHDKTLAGPLNAVTPFPVTNKQMTTMLGKLLHRPTWLTIPAFMVKIMFGQLGKEVLLSSVDVQPKKLERAGFAYLYPSLEDFLKTLLSRK